MKLIGNGRQSSQVRQSERNTFIQERTHLYFVCASMFNEIPGGLNDKYVCFNSFSMIRHVVVGFVGFAIIRYNL